MIESRDSAHIRRSVSKVMDSASNSHNSFFRRSALEWRTPTGLGRQAQWPLKLGVSLNIRRIVSVTFPQTSIFQLNTFAGAYLFNV